MSKRSNFGQGHKVKVGGLNATVLSVLTSKYYVEFDDKTRKMVMKEEVTQ